ncbi:glycosyltransferase family 2 protein [Marinobacter halotolerans]|uniref:glycosyltransferase family 2 protein n=1 Tax=Marinobacter halotolerans TaxID=1569211 RepID=UPI0012444C7E|nr:glycosyltransferase family 2 protein [Marinobacter halotolerans]
MKLPLSVYYITLNEELRLPESLAKVAGWADEIIVVDSGSTDRTREIAEAAGARFVHNDWEGFACQKAFAASLCRNDWVLDLDADEVLSDKLVRTVKEVFSKPVDADIAGFRMRWVLSQPDSRHPFRHDKSKKILRLYNRKMAAIEAQKGSNDDRPRVKSGRVVDLEGDVLHRTLISLEQMERKYCQLSSEQARFMAEKGRKISSARLFVEFPLKFLKYYLLHRQILNGWFGLSVAITAANRNFMRLAKARELQMLAALDKERARK